MRLRKAFDDTRDVVWGMLRRLGVPADHVEEAFHEVYLVTSQHLGDTVRGNERAFVYGATLRVARTCLRAHGRALSGNDARFVVPTLPAADESFDTKRLIELFDAILLRLPLEAREAFVLHELGGLSGAELAALLEISEGDFHSLLRRAQQLIHARIDAVTATLPEVSRG